MNKDTWNKSFAGQFGTVDARILVQAQNSQFRQEFIRISGTTNVGDFVDTFLDSQMEMTIGNEVVYRGTMRGLVIDRLMQNGMILLDRGIEHAEG